MILECQFWVIVGIICYVKFNNGGNNDCRYNQIYAKATFDKVIQDWLILLLYSNQFVVRTQTEKFYYRMKWLILSSISVIGLAVFFVRRTTNNVCKTFEDYYTNVDRNENCYYNPDADLTVVSFFFINFFSNK